MARFPLESVTQKAIFWMTEVACRRLPRQVPHTIGVLSLAHNMYTPTEDRIHPDKVLTGTEIPIQVTIVLWSSRPWHGRGVRS